MRIQAIVQFYLDALLPRDSSWTNWSGFKLDAPAFTAFVSAWDPTKEPLFPNEVDESVSAEVLSLVPPPEFSGGSIVRRVGESVVDRLRVVLEWEEEDSAGSNTPAFDLVLAQERAVDAANMVIGHLRCAARTPHLQRIRRTWSWRSGRLEIMAPWTISVFNLDTNEQLPVFGDANALRSTGSIKAPLTGEVSITEIGRIFNEGPEPPLHLMLLLDAENRLEEMALREAILDTASACEIAATTYIHAKAGADAEAYIEQLRGSFAKKFYETAPTRYSSRSLRQDDPSAYDQAQEMYRERNRLMHSGRMRPELANLPLRERQRTVHGYLGAGYRATDWIMSLT